MNDLYYIQHKGFCGNCLFWWREGGHGYTCDLNLAWKVSLEKAIDICESRPKEDILWPVRQIDKLSARHVTGPLRKEV